MIKKDYKSRGMTCPPYLLTIHIGKKEFRIKAHPNAAQRRSQIQQSNIYLVKAKAQLGEDGLTPKICLVKAELHLATIPFVGRFENNSFLIH